MDQREKCLYLTFTNGNFTRLIVNNVLLVHYLFEKHLLNRFSTSIFLSGQQRELNAPLETQKEMISFKNRIGMEKKAN